MLHTVEHGDTLADLAQRYGVGVADILRENPGVDFARVDPGTALNIPSTSPPAPAESPRENEQLRLTLRRLWQRQATLTRMTMMSVIYDLPGLVETAARLADNAGELREALAPIFGTAAASAFGKLLGEHATLAQQLAQAAKAGDFRASREAENTFVQNTEKMAGLLAPAPGRREKFLSLLRDYAEATRGQALALTNKQYDKGLRLFGLAEEAALAIADLLAAGP